MEELIRQVTTALRGMWRFRWYGVVVAWSVAIVGVAVVMRIPDRYEADARIFVDTQSILKPLMSGLAVQPNVEQQVVMLSRTLLSRPNVEKLIRMADLDLNVKTKVEQEALVDGLVKRLEIKSTQRDNLYTLAFQDEDGAKAKRVVQSLVSIFVDSSLGATRQDTDSAKAFLDEQIKNYETKLREAELRLKEFKVRNIDLQTADGLDATGQLSSVAAQLNQARLELREAELGRDAIKQQMAELEKGGGELPSGTPSLLGGYSAALATPEIDARLAAQKSNLDTLLQRFTDQHPDVISTRRLIADLEAQKKAELAARAKAQAEAPTTAVGGGGSLMQQELGRMLAATEVSVASLRARVGEYNTRLQQARERMKTAPQIEAEAAQLNRDYAVHKQNYDSLVARRESASLSGELDTVAGVADFRLIDPPRVSAKPVAPNRLLLLPLALVAGLGAGLAIAFLLSQLRPVFHAAGDLRDKVGLPLLGVVSAVVGDRQRRRERASLMRFSLASGGLVGLFVAGMAAMTVLGR